MDDIDIMTSVLFAISVIFVTSMNKRMHWWAVTKISAGVLLAVSLVTLMLKGPALVLYIWGIGTVSLFLANFVYVLATMRNKKQSS